MKEILFVILNLSFGMTGKRKFYFWTPIGGLLVVLLPLAFAPPAIALQRSNWRAGIFQHPGKAEASWFNENKLYRQSKT